VTRDASAEVAALDDDGLIGGNPDRYEYAGEHGRGGLGRVVRAQDKSLGRQVAIKELLKDSHSAEARFVREAMVTARLEHPGIVPVHEAGRWPSGEPYYVMKLISGRTLKELARSPCSLDERLALLPNAIAVAEAIAYAHSEGVIHRDLKPANVVIGEFGETVVIDWGLAKDLRASGDEDRFVGESSVSGEQTVIGDVLGTPAYMPPEQARGDEVDERADVYSLGAMLYEVLAGKSPYTGVQSGEIIARVLDSGPEPLERLQPSVPADLLAIVRKATAREPEDRYPTAREFADDLKRFTTGQLVTAHSYSTAALVRRWVWRHRAVVAVAIVGMAILAVIGVVSVQRVVRERNVAEDQRERAEQRGHQLVFNQAKTSLKRDPTAAVAWLKTYPLDGPEGGAVPGMLDEARAAGVARHVLQHGDWVRGAVFTADGKGLATASQDGVIRIWDVETGRARVVGRTEHGNMGVALSSDGKHLATGTMNGEVELWDISTGERREVGRHLGDVYALFFSGDGERLYCVGNQGMLSVWDVGAAKPVAVKQKGMVGAAIAADGTMALSANKDGEIFVYDGDFSNKRLLVKLPSPPRKGNVSADGTLSAVHCEDEIVRLVDVRTKEIRELGRRTGRIESAVFSPDSRRLATAGDDGVAHVWDLGSGEVRVLRGHDDFIYMAAFSPDGTVLVTAGDDGTARVWDLATGDVDVLRGHEDDVVSVTFSPDGSMLATTSLDSTARIWPLRFDDARVLTGGAERENVLRRAGVGRTPAGAIGDLSLVDEGRRAVILGQDGELRVWDIASGESSSIGASAVRYLIVPFRPPLSPDGRFVATPGKDSTVDLWEVATATHHQLRAHAASALGMAFSPDSRTLITGGKDGRVLLWNLETREPEELTRGEPVQAVAAFAEGTRAVIATERELSIWDTATRTLEKTLDRLEEDAPPHHVKGLHLSPDGRWLLAAGWRLQTPAWDLQTGESRILAKPPFHATDFAYSADGRWLAMAAGDRTVHLWDMPAGERRILQGHTDLLMQLAFSPDGGSLASASYDKTIRLWNVDTGHARVLRGHAASVDTVAFTPDGRSIVSGSRDGTVRVWSLSADGPMTPRAARARMEELTTAEIGPDDRPVSSDSP